MADESSNPKQDKRRRQILAATLRLLRKHGAGISTAQIAAEANCSKETLYNWFEDRDGILLALAEEQARGMGAALETGFRVADGRDDFRDQVTGSFETRLKAYATCLLDILTGDAVIVVNRIAMAQACDDVSTLGQSVLAAWREQVLARFTELFAEGVKAGAIVVYSGEEAFEDLIGLLVGDRQRRLLLGENARPETSKMAAEAEKAVRRWLILYRA